MTTHRAPEGYRLTVARVVHSEWTKLWTLRSTWWVLGLTGLSAIVLAGVVGRFTERAPGAPVTVEQAVGETLFAVDAVALVLGVLGVLLVTGEYGSGSIRASLTAVPRRLPVLAAKALVLVAVAAPWAGTICVTSFLANQALTEASQRVVLSDPNVLRALFGAAAVIVGSGLIGLGIGALVRHTAGAVTAYAAALLVVPTLLRATLPDSAEERVLPYTPTMAGQAIHEVGESATFPWLLSPGAGALVLASWALALLAGGAIALYRRDV